MASASEGDAPFASRVRAPGPYVVLAEACVATAPTPARAKGTTDPTEKNRLATATPTSPASGSAATIENVDGDGPPAATSEAAKSRKMGTVRSTVGKFGTKPPRGRRFSLTAARAMRPARAL